MNEHEPIARVEIAEAARPCRAAVEVILERPKDALVLPVVVVREVMQLEQHVVLRDEPRGHARAGEEHRQARIVRVHGATGLVQQLHFAEELRALRGHHAEPAEHVPGRERREQREGQRETDHGAAGARHRERAEREDDGDRRREHEHIARPETLEEHVQQREDEHRRCLERERDEQCPTRERELLPSHEEQRGPRGRREGHVPEPGHHAGEVGFQKSVDGVRGNRGGHIRREVNEPERIAVVDGARGQVQRRERRGRSEPRPSALRVEETEEHDGAEHRRHLVARPEREPGERRTEEGGPTAAGVEAQHRGEERDAVGVRLTRDRREQERRREGEERRRDLSLAAEPLDGVAEEKDAERGDDHVREPIRRPTEHGDGGVEQGERRVDLLEEEAGDGRLADDACADVREVTLVVGPCRH